MTTLACGPWSCEIGDWRITSAKRKGATTAQLSLAWLLAQKPFIVPIPGTGKVKHLQENIESTKLVLTAEDMKEIASALIVRNSVRIPPELRATLTLAIR
jgi:aryl-alcohol dehydrogenase-like predicted oxidoreductase